MGSLHFLRQALQWIGFSHACRKLQNNRLVIFWFSCSSFRATLERLLYVGKVAAVWLWFALGGLPSVEELQSNQWPILSFSFTDIVTVRYVVLSSTLQRLHFKLARTGLAYQWVWNYSQSRDWFGLICFALSAAYISHYAGFSFALERFPCALDWLPECIVFHYARTKCFTWL